MVYHLYDKSNLTKEKLMQDRNFVSDASSFLIDREGYTAEEMTDPEAVYDAYMEHFRVQNVNEITATRDLMYAENTDDAGRERLGKLMDTFDNMDSDFGWKAALDYAEGTVTSPSTYLGVFTGGAGKVGALAANQGLKLGIRQLVKSGLAGKELRKGALRGAAAAAAVDAPLAAGTVYAQEKTRVATDIKDEVDFSDVGLAATISTLTAGTIGGALGTKDTLTSNVAEQIRMVALGKERAVINSAHKNATTKVLNSTKKSNLKGKSTVGKDAKEIVSNIKLAMSETVPEKIKEGAALRKEFGELETKEIENIAAAASRIMNKIKPKGKVNPKTGKIKEERLSSRLARGLSDGEINEKQVAGILKEHNVTMRQLGSLFAERLSSAGAELGAVGRIAKKEKETILKELTAIDVRLVDAGNITQSARMRLEKNPVKGAGPKQSNLYKNWFSLGALNKARIGFMTTQLATTARNTTNGYMRNYVYAMDNLGTGLANLGYGQVTKLRSIGNKELAAEAQRAINLGKAQMVTGGQSLYGKDLWMGTTSWETAALDKLFRDAKFGKSNLAKEIYREMGDIGELTGEEGGILFLARKANYLNTLSDNMFKRAVFSREVDKRLRAAGQKGGLKGFFKEAYLDPKMAKKSAGMFSRIDDKVIGQAMEEALSFTYQTGKFAGKTGYFNKGADFFIDLASKNLLVSQGVPFPRYLVNQLIFAYEHIPILGMFDFGSGILKKQGDELPDYASRFGKTFGGLATLGAFLGIRNQFGDETTGPYDYYSPANPNKTFDARANLGPFMAFAMMADLLYRFTGPNRKEVPGGGTLPQLHDNDKVAVDIPYSTREIVAAFTGGQARAGVGLDLMDGMANLAVNYEEGGIGEQSFKENTVKLIANFFNTYTVPAGMLKDIAGTFMGPEYRTVEDKTDIDMMEYFFKQAGRSIPNAYEPDKGDVPVGRPTRSEPLKNVNPFLKLLTGFTEQDSRTKIEKELDRLKFDYVELSPRKIRLDAPLTNEARLRMGKYMEREVYSFFASPDYQNLPGDRIKRVMLKEQINNFRTKARNEVMKIKVESTSDEDRLRGFKTKWNNMSSGKRGVVADIYRQQSEGRDLYKDLADPDMPKLLYEWANSVERDLYGGE